MAQVRLKPQYQPPPGTPGMPKPGEITYTPDGQPRAPGFYNPSNPWDQGYGGSINAEVARRNGYNPGKMDGWNYDTGTPNPGYNPNQYGGSGGTPTPGGMSGGAGALAGSPYYQQVLAATNAAAAADAAGRRTAIQQGLIGYGLVPEGFKDKYGDVDALTRELAAKNTSTGISTHARLLQARADAIRQFSRFLSSRGLRRSGAKGYGLRRRQLQYDQSSADALSKLLGYFGSLYGQFSQNEYQRQLALANALAYASSSLGGYGGGGGSGGGFAYDPNTSTAAKLDIGGYFGGGGGFVRPPSIPGGSGGGSGGSGGGGSWVPQ